MKLHYMLGPLVCKDMTAFKIDRHQEKSFLDNRVRLYNVDSNNQMDLILFTCTCTKQVHK